MNLVVRNDGIKNAPGVVSEEENRMVNKMEAENRAGKQMLALKDDLFFFRWLLVVNQMFCDETLDTKSG